MQAKKDIRQRTLDTEEGLRKAERRLVEESKRVREKEEFLKESLEVSKGDERIEWGDATKLIDESTIGETNKINCMCLDYSRNIDEL